MPILAQFNIDPIENLGHVLHLSILGDKVISDIFHFFYTLRKMQDQGFIEEYVEIPPQGGIWFLKMNETRYKYINGKWETQKPYRVSKQRLDFLLEKLPICSEWSPEEKRLAKRYYTDYHERIAKTFSKNIGDNAVHETS